MSLKRNVAANTVSQVWLVLMSFAFIPLYIRYLGVEAYGLIGFFAGLQAWVAVIDLGLSMTLNREMARTSVLPGGGRQAREMLGAAELAYAFTGAVLALSLWFAAPFLADTWFRASRIAPVDLSLSIRLLGLALVLRWASQIYRAGIQGLQQQVWLGGFTVLSSTLRALGAVAGLVWLGGDLVDFFSWQLGVSALELVVLRTRLHASLPPREKGTRPSLAALKPVWRFAAGVFVTDLMAAVMTQSDKLILSKMLTLEEFGYYSFAFTAGTAVAVLKTPLFQAVSPRLSADIASGHAPSFVNTYHRASQAMAVLVLPGAAIALFHAHPLITAWSGDGQLADHTARLTAVFVAAYALNALIHVPAALALSSGWSAWGMVTNTLAAVLIVPTVMVATAHFGAIGAALSNLALNALYFLVAVRLLHRRLLVTEWKPWFLRDGLLPMGVALAVAAALTPLIPDGSCRLCTGFWLGLAWMLVSIAVALSLPYPRSLLSGAGGRLRQAWATATSGAP